MLDLIFLVYIEVYAPHSFLSNYSFIFGVWGLPLYWSPKKLQTYLKGSIPSPVNPCTEEGGKLEKAAPEAM